MSRSYRTRSSQHVTLTLLSGGKGESESASSPFGPVRAGLTTTPDLLTARADQDRQLSVLLNTLERQAEILLLKSYEVLDTFLTDTTHLVEPTHFKNATTTTEEIKC
jgi:hypothetical protein